MYFGVKETGLHIFPPETRTEGEHHKNEWILESAPILIIAHIGHDSGGNFDDGNDDSGDVNDDNNTV